MANKKLELTKENIPSILVQFFSSFGLATTVLVLMTVLTFFGTLNQKEEGLHQSLSLYFHSLWVTDTAMGFPVFLPGGALLMGILSLNIFLGTVLKIRRKPETIGLFLTHIGILGFVLASFVTRYFAWEGFMAFFEGEEANRAVAHHDWQLEIVPVQDDGTTAEEALVIKQFEFARAHQGRPRRFLSKDLPFDVVIEHYEHHSRPLPASLPVIQAEKENLTEVDGHVLYPLPRDTTNERNTPGVYAKFIHKDGTEVSAILGGDRGVDSRGNFVPFKPYTLSFDDKKWNVQLVQEQFLIPFTVQLDKFHPDFHPGTSRAKNYQSDVTKIETLPDGGTIEEKIKIKMNEPLRYRGYTFFQSSYGQNLDGDYYSNLTVWRNPADHWPLYSLWIIGVGLFLHFGLKLGQHLNKASGTKTSEPSTQPEPKASSL